MVVSTSLGEIDVAPLGFKELVDAFIACVGPYVENIVDFVGTSMGS